MYSCCRVPTVFKPVEDQHKPKYETKDARRLVSGTQQAELDTSGDTPHHFMWKGAYCRNYEFRASVHCKRRTIEDFNKAFGPVWLRNELKLWNNLHHARIKN